MLINADFLEPAVKQAAQDMAVDILTACDEYERRWLASNSFIGEQKLLDLALQSYPFLNQDEVDLIDGAISDLLDAEEEDDADDILTYEQMQAVTDSNEDFVKMVALLEKAKAKPALQCIFCKVDCVPTISMDTELWEPETRTWVNVPPHITHDCPKCRASLQRFDETILHMR